MIEIDHFIENCNIDCVLESEIPEKCKKEPCCLGVDEAGRGPVLGPMVYGIAFYPISKSKEMEKKEFADSKQLTEKKREEIFEKIKNNQIENFGWMAKILSPVTISNSMLRRSKYNLNLLSHDTAIFLIRNAIDKGANITQIFVDTVGPAQKYEAKLSELFPGIKCTVAQKADSKYTVVSAASICAKVTRDHCINRWKFPEKVELKNLDYGSGYPGDPKTKAFLRSNLDPIFGFPTFIRFSWSTANNLLESDAIPVEWEEFDEEEKDPFSKPTSKQITTFFKPKEVSGDKITRNTSTNDFFGERMMTRVTSFKGF